MALVMWPECAWHRNATIGSQLADNKPHFPDNNNEICYYLLLFDGELSDIIVRNLKFCNNFRNIADTWKSLGHGNKLRVPLRRNVVLQMQQQNLRDHVIELKKRIIRTKAHIMPKSRLSFAFCQSIEFHIFFIEEPVFTLQFLKDHKKHNYRLLVSKRLSGVGMWMYFPVVH